MNRTNIEKIAKTPEDRLLLAKLWDKIDAGMRKNIIASTCFLSPRELELSRFLFGAPEELHEFGGYEDAERKMLVYLPDYLEEAALTEEDSPVVCLRATFFHGDSPSHRDFLGALIGAGISRENIGDTQAYQWLRKMAMDKRIPIIVLAQALIEQEQSADDVAYMKAKLMREKQLSRVAAEKKLAQRARELGCSVEEAARQMRRGGGGQA